MSLQRLDYQEGEIWLHVDSSLEETLRVKACQKEPETIEWISTMQPGESFLDIGACCGSYSLIAAFRGLNVCAIEPAPFNAERIHMNANANDLTINVIQMAMGDYDGYCDFEWSSRESGAALHSLRIDSGSIPIRKLDSLAGSFDHIKIDVDGSELRVIKGGMNTWPKVQSVQVEIDDSLPGWPETIGLLQDSGLRVEKWTRHGNKSISNVLFRR